MITRYLVNLENPVILSKDLFYRHLLHLDLRHGPIVSIRLTRRDRIHHVLTLSNSSKDRVTRRQRIINVHDEKL